MFVSFLPLHKLCFNCVVTEVQVGRNMAGENLDADLDPGTNFFVSAFCPLHKLFRTAVQVCCLLEYCLLEKNASVSESLV